MSALEVLPVIEELVIAWMTHDADIVAALGPRVSSRRPGADATYPLAVVERVSGVQPEWWEDQARVQVSIYGDLTDPGELAAAGLAQLIAAASVRLCGTTWTLTAGTAAVSSAECIAGPFPGFDPENGRPFRHLDLLIQTHPGSDA